MYAGIDIGSRTIKVVTISQCKIVHMQVVHGGCNPRQQAQEMLQALPPLSRLVTTGYGRHLELECAAPTSAITEIKAHALGVRYHYDTATTVLDVGGQDSKVISLNPGGGVAGFHMNDKCAAGTGRFLEMMALGLGCGLEEFAELAATGDDSVTINSMCAVFAESEVISLKNSGHSAANIARAVHVAVAQRLAAMVLRNYCSGQIVFSGGVANNPFMRQCLQQELATEITIPPRPDTVGALGAAIHAASIG